MVQLYTPLNGTYLLNLLFTYVLTSYVRWLNVLAKHVTMATSLFSTGTVLLYTKSKMYWSHAKDLPYSLDYGTNEYATVFHCSKRKGSGNHVHWPSIPRKHCNKPTASMTSHPPNKHSNRCMHCVGTRSNRLGWGQSRQATSLVGHSSQLKTSRRTILKQARPQKCI